MDNYERYGIPRSESGYRTPGMAEYKAETDAYLERMWQIISAKRLHKKAKECSLVTRQGLERQRENNTDKVALSQLATGEIQVGQVAGHYDTIAEDLSGEASSSQQAACFEEEAL